MTDEIIDLIKIKKERKDKLAEKSAKKLPWALNEYIRLRNQSIAQITELRKLINEFEEHTLTFSKNYELSGPQIDQYILYKLTLDYAINAMKENDKTVKDHYAYDLPPFD
jgi:hypothetical protein